MEQLGNNFNNAGSWLLETLLTLYSLILLLRLILQWAKADYRNPLVQIITLLTDPLVKPLRRILPPLGKIDSASLFLFLLATMLIVTFWDPLAATGPLIIMRTLTRSLHLILSLYSILILATVIISWLGQSWRHPIIPLIYQLTEPVLLPLRRLLPAVGGFDFSPIVALIAIQFLRLLVGY